MMYGIILRIHQLLKDFHVLDGTVDPDLQFRPFFIGLIGIVIIYNEAANLFINSPAAVKNETFVFGKASPAV